MFRLTSPPTSTMSLAKIPLLIGASLCVHRVITAPNPPPPVEETSKYRDLWPRSYMVWGTGLSKVCLIPLLLRSARLIQDDARDRLQCTLTLSSRCSPSFASTLLHHRMPALRSKRSHSARYPSSVPFLHAQSAPPLRSKLRHPFCSASHLSRSPRTSARCATAHLGVFSLSKYPSSRSISS